jgi:homoserine kinase
MHYHDLQPTPSPTSTVLGRAALALARQRGLFPMLVVYLAFSVPKGGVYSQHAAIVAGKMSGNQYPECPGFCPKCPILGSSGAVIVAGLLDSSSGQRRQ